LKPIPDPGVKKGARSLIRNTAENFLKIQIRESVILKYGSGSGRPVNCGSGSYLDIFVAIGKYMVVGHIIGLY
jgi:hypothetical protein